MITTIVMPVSRLDFIKRIFAQLELLTCNRETTNLLVYVDGDMELFDKTNNFVLGSKFNEKMCIYRHKGLPNISHIRSRRKRIADIHNELRLLTPKCDYLFLIEDDTLLPLNALEKLLHLYTINPHAGFITGVQIGRWGYTVPGIWKVDNPYAITKVISQLPIPNEVQEIDGSGLYCMLIKRDHYIDHKFEPFEDILGPDVSLGFWLRREGFKNYVDWSINTSHLTKRGEIKVYNTPLQQMTFTKNGEKWEIAATDI